jgi:hypothetical protein
MSRPRFTIGGVILVVAVIGVELAAIRSGSPEWAGAMLSITFFALLCSFLGIVLGRGMRRVYWSGFALLGWSYLFLMYVPWLATNVGQFLFAPNLFESLHEVLHPIPPGGAGMGGAGAMGVSGGLRSVPVQLIAVSATGGGFDPGPPFSAAEASDFQRIGIAIEALLWAFIGGWVACYFASGREEENRSRRETPAETLGDGQQRTGGAASEREPLGA